VNVAHEDRDQGGLRQVLSVVIPAYNAAAFLGVCLDSVSSQRGPFEMEVIVVDDGSTDETAEVARAHMGVRLVRLERNMGPSAARNAGVAAARGELIAFLDADDLWPARSLVSRLEVLRQHPEAGFVFSDCRQFDATGLRAQTLFEAGGLGIVAWGPEGTLPDAHRRLLAANFVTTGSVVARRAALIDAGGFAEDLRLVEDLDLWLRLARRYPVAWCGEVGLLRRRHSDNLSRDSRTMSLAYLEVLRRQAADPAALTPQLEADLSALAAKEWLHLAYVALASGRLVEASGWAWQSLRTRPSAPALARVARALKARLCAPTTPPPR
jgi:glycosyltransferase involved in cell wall biosynthesis